MLSVHVLATYILPQFELAQNIENNMVGTQHLWQRRDHPVGITWLQLQTKKFTGLSSPWQSELAQSGKIAHLFFSLSGEKNEISMKENLWGINETVAQIAKLACYLQLIHVNL